MGHWLCPRVYILYPCIVLLQTFITIRDKTQVSPKVLGMIGQRLAEYLFESKDASETARILSALPVPVTAWLRKQVCDVLFRRIVFVQRLRFCCAD